MAEITLKINHRGYSMCCDEGQEERLRVLAAYVDSRLRDIAAAGAATNDSHLLVLTSLVLADEVFDMRDELSSLRDKLDNSSSDTATENEAVLVEAIDYLADKIERISGRLQISEQSGRSRAA